MPKKTRSPRAGAAAPVDGAPRARRERGWLAGILLLTAAVYARTLSAGFIYFDDPDSVVRNPYIRAISGANLVRWLTTPVQYMYMPVALLSYAIDHQLGGPGPFVYHLTNVLLHLGNVALVFWVLRLLTGRPRTALLVSLLFAVHPVNVDTVAWVAARTNLLATFFSLCALGCYGLYLERGGRLRFLALAWLAFVLAAGAKSSAVVLPLTLFLWDLFQGRRWSWRLVLEKLPFLAVALALGVVGIAMRTDDVLPPVHYGPLDRALVFAYALAHYCVRLVAPWNLAMSYDYPAVRGGWLPLPFYLAPPLLAAIGWGLHRLRVPRKVLAFGLPFFVLGVAPSQSVLHIDSFMASRYVYLPYLGLLLVLADALERVAGAPPAGARAAQEWTRPRAAVAAALVVLAAAFARLTYARTAVWHDSTSLLDDVIAKQPGSAWVWGTRGIVALHAGDLAGARRDLDEALRLDPRYTPALCYRGALHLRTQDYRAALADLDRAIALHPGTSGAYRDRGRARLGLQDEQGALEDLDRAIALDRWSDAHFLRGMVRGSRGDYAGARDDFDVSVAVSPGDGQAFFMRGLTELQLDRHDAACADVATARRLGYQPPEGQPVPVCP